MPIIIEGYLVTSTKKLKDHAGHELASVVTGDRVRLDCLTDGITIETEPEPREPDLPCGCATVEDHNTDVALQTKLRKEFRIHKDACVGCYLGDDGISIHSCVIHDRRYWPEAS